MIFLMTSSLFVKIREVLEKVIPQLIIYSFYKNKLFYAFIDFAAAFDTVWRDGLWNKLLINQINGKMYNVIFNMYNGSKSRVVYNCNKT